MPGIGSRFPTETNDRKPRSSSGATRVLRLKAKIGRSAKRAATKANQTPSVVKSPTAEEPPTGCSAWWSF